MNADPIALRIASRKSPLALWQARHVAALLETRYTDCSVSILPLSTSGDRLLNVSLQQHGGKGLFTKELERALLDGEADLAVHSMKDMTVEMPEGLELIAVLEREDPHDVLLSPGGLSLNGLAEGARLGTGSARRQGQLRARRADLRVLDLRGNVGTRLQRLDAGEFDAIVLARAGLTRLGIERPSEVLDYRDCLPAIGQGALGIQCRRRDAELRARLAALEDPETAACVRAERALNRALGGSCLLPIAALASTDGEGLQLRARVMEPDGSRLLEAAASGTAGPQELGDKVAEQLLRQGADGILAGLQPR